MQYLGYYTESKYSCGECAQNMREWPSKTVFEKVITHLM
jgi:hypothetical protein